MTYDLIIRNGIVVDGTGLAPCVADIALSEGLITEIGKIKVPGKNEIDAKGLIVSPGFVDIHTHYDAQVCWDPNLGSSLEHGVTTVVLGNCGIGIAPSKKSHQEINALDLVSLEGMSIDVLKAGIPWKWESFVEYMDFIEEKKPGINISLLVPLAPLRRYVMGDDAIKRSATKSETEHISSLLRDAIQAGANGFSTTTLLRQRGWQGQPLACALAGFDELRAYARVLGDMGRGVIQANCATNLGVLSDEEYNLLEMLLIESGRPISWSGAVSRSDRPEDLDTYLQKIQPLILRGGKPQGTSRPLTVEVNLKNPFIMNDISAGKKVLGQPEEVQRKHYSDPAFRREVLDEYEKGGKLFGKAWIDCQVLRVGSSKMKKYLRRSVREIALERRMDPIDTFFELALEDDLNLRYLGAVANTDDDRVRRQINDERILLGMSDGGAHVDMLLESNYTTFILGYWVRERGAMSIERAVYRMTAEPAKQFGIFDRGILAPGMAADVVVFDKNRIGSAMKATHIKNDLPGGGERLYAESEGINYVIVNGNIAYQQGNLSSIRSGKLLRN